MKVRTLDALDGSWWEAELPGGWVHSQEKTIKNVPHVFRSPSGSGLVLFVGKDAWFSAGAFGPDPPNDLSEAQKVAFQLAATGAKSRGAVISRKPIGRMLGFFFVIEDGWEGSLSLEPYVVRAVFRRSPSAPAEDERLSWAILESLHLAQP